jgi:hypothetical protein
VDNTVSIFYQLLIKDLLENGFAEDVETRTRLAEKAKKLTSLDLAGRSASWGLHIALTKQTVVETKKFCQSWSLSEKLIYLIFSLICLMLQFSIAFSCC